MALYVKSGALGGGSWRAISNGTCRIKSGGLGGGSWFAPSYIYTKYGASFRDSGYRGYPSDPTSLAVNYWNYNEVRIQWAAGAGGAPVSGYNIVQTDSAGNWLRQYNVAGSPSPANYFPVNDDSYYRFYVRSYTAGGQYSNWDGPLNVKIGHAAYTTYTDDPATRAYSLAKSVVGYKDAAVGPTIPSAVDVQTIRYQITNGFSGVLSPYGTHSISRWANSGEYEQFNWPSQSIDTTLNVSDYGSNGGVQGMICRGTGWSTAATGSYVATGTITVNGIEHYTAHNAHSHPAVANGYW